MATPFDDLIPSQGTAAPSPTPDATVNPFADLMPAPPGMLATGVAAASDFLHAIHPVVPALTPAQAADLGRNEIPSALYGAAERIPGIQSLLGGGRMGGPIAKEFNRSASQANQNYPTAYGVGGLGGITAMGLFGAGGGEAAVAPFLGDAAATTLAPAMIRGAAEGVGAAALPNPGVGGNRLENAVIGAGIGGTLPVLQEALKPLVAGTVFLRNKAGDYLKSFTDAGRKADLGEGLLKIAGGSIPPLQEAPLPGMKLSLGQVTGSPGILALEKGAYNTAPGQSAYGVLRNANNQAMFQAAKGITPGIAPDNLPNLSTNLEGSLEQARQAVDTRERTLWQAVDPNNEFSIPKSGVQQTIKNVTQQLGPVRASQIPSEFSNLMDKLPDNIPVMHFKDFRSVVGNLARKYSYQGDANASNALNELYSGLTEHLKNVQLNPISTTDPDIQAATNRIFQHFGWKPEDDVEAKAAQDRFNTARQFSLEKHQIFSTNPLARMFRTDSTGAAAVEPESIGKRLLNPATPSGVDQANAAFEKANVPKGKEDMANMLVSKLFNDASVSKVDSGGNRYITGAGFNKALRENQPLIQRAIPNKTSQYVLDQIGKAAEMNDRIQTVAGTGNSTTPLDLSTHRFIDELMNRYVQPTPIEGGLLGGIVGNTLEKGGALPGYVAGRLGTGVLRRITGENANKMQQLIYDAISNPKEGLTLMQQASDRNAAKLGPVMKKYWKSPLLYGPLAAPHH